MSISYQNALPLVFDLGRHRDYIPLIDDLGSQSNKNNVKIRSMIRSMKSFKTTEKRTKKTWH